MGEKEFFKFLDEGAVTRLRFRLQTAGGEVGRFVVPLEVLVSGEWRVVVRYDSAHGFIHRDQMLANGRQVKKEIPLPDMAAAIAFAEQDLVDRWEWYIEKYRGSKRRRLR
jgi:hypothetical protein